MRLARDRMHVVPAFRDRLRAAGLDTADRVLKCLGDQVVAWSRSTDAVRVDLPAEAGGGAVYIKRYHFLRWKPRIKAMLRGAFLGRSRAGAEFDRLEGMLAEGAPVVRPLAYGERRILHFVRSSFLITEAVGDGVSLTTFAQRFADSPAAGVSLQERRRLIESLGRCVGGLHRKGVTHGALFWRNVLVRRDGKGFAFVLLDAPGRRRPAIGRAADRRAAAVVADLAAMAALAPEFCSRAEMMRFYRAYLGTPRLDAAQRGLARDVTEAARPLLAHELYRLKMDRIFHYHLVPA